MEYIIKINERTKEGKKLVEFLKSLGVVKIEPFNEKIEDKILLNLMEEEKKNGKRLKDIEKLKKALR